MNYKHLLSVKLNNERVTKATKTASVNKLVKDLKKLRAIEPWRKFAEGLTTQGLLQINNSIEFSNLGNLPFYFN